MVSLLMEHVPEPAAALRGHAQKWFSSMIEPTM